jgi:hypothetical protein
MLRNNIAKISIIFCLIAALAVGVAIPVSADSTPTTTTPALTTVQGIVTAVNPSSSSSTASTFTIRTANSTLVTVSVDPNNTKYYLIPVGKVQSWVNNKVTQDKSDQSTAAKLKNLHIPANWRDNLGFLETFIQKGSFSDIAVNDRIIARVNSSEVATQVVIIKAPVIQQVRGTITISTSNNGITINALNGKTLNLTYNSNTEFTIKGYALPTGGYAVVTYDTTTMIATLVNFTANEPTPAVTTTTTTTP